jgi:uncharacterized membrane protein YdbT with pleckstrin-like domain
MNKQLWSAIVVGMLLSNTAFSQAAQTGSAMENTMYASGKIYVVVAVMVAMLMVLIAYLVRIDRRLTKLEQQEVKNKNS